MITAYLLAMTISINGKYISMERAFSDWDVCFVTKKIIENEFKQLEINKSCKIAFLNQNDKNKLNKWEIK